MRFLLEVEQVHLGAELAVVALGGFLEPGKVRIELLLVEPAGAIDARQLRVLLIAAPIGTRDAHQLEGGGVELAGRGQVRAAAHVEPVVARPVNGQFLVFGQFLGPFGLERLTLGCPFVDQLLTAPHFAAQRLVGADDLAHLFLDGGQIVHREGLARGRGHHVIIKAVIGCRAEGDLRAGKQRLHRLCEHVREIVARQFQCIGLVLRGDERQLGIAFERAVDIAQFAIDARGDRRLGKARPDRCRDVRRGSPGRNLSDGAVG